MTIQDCLTQMRAVKDAAFATVDENGRPQVRIIDIMLIADDTIIFCTARGKNFYRELLRDGHVAVTCLSKDWKMLRLNGVAQRLDDQHTWIDRIFAANPSMNDVYPGDARYVLEAFCIAQGELECFDLGVSSATAASAAAAASASAPSKRSAPARRSSLLRNTACTAASVQKPVRSVPLTSGVNPDGC